MDGGITDAMLARSSSSAASPTDASTGSLTSSRSSQPLPGDSEEADAQGRAPVSNSSLLASRLGGSIVSTGNISFGGSIEALVSASGSSPKPESGARGSATGSRRSRLGNEGRGAGPHDSAAAPLQLVGKSGSTR